MPSTSTTPSPWKTLARTLLRALYALLILTFLWSLWYAYAAHRLNSKLAQYRALGQPVSPKDLVDPPVPPTENSYDLLLAAADSLKLSPDEQDVVESSTRTSDTALPLSPADMATIQSMLASHAPTLDLLRQARTAPHIAWPDQLSSYFGKSPLHLSEFRRLTRFRRIAVLYYHQNQRDDLALYALRDMNTAAATPDHGEFLLNHLVAISNYAATAQTLIHIAPDLEIQSLATPHGIPRNEVLALIRELLDDREIHQGLLRSFMSERVFDKAMMDHIDRGTILLRPMLRLSLLCAFGQYDGIISAIGPTSTAFPIVKSHLPIFPTYADTNLAATAHLIDYYLLSSYEKAIELHCRGLTDRRAAALRLALRLYQLDHQNQIPPDLASLVPAYIPAIPVDIFRADNGPLTYVPARRLFYSYSTNGIDDGGTLSLTSYSPVVNWRSPDAVYPLDRPIPPTPTGSPTSTPVTP